MEISAIEIKTNWIVRILRHFDLLLPIIIKILFEIAYITKYSPFFDYLGATYDPNIVKMWFSWIPIIVFMLLRNLGRKTKLTCLFNLYFFISIIPSFSIFWLKDENINACILIFAYWIIWWGITFLLSNREHDDIALEQKPMFRPYSGNILLAGIYIVVLVTTLYMSAVYGEMRLFINLNDVYTYRLADNSMGSFWAYILAWNTNIFIPFFLGLHYIQKHYALFAIDALLLLFSYGIYGNKSMLFSIVLVAGLIILYKMGSLKYTDTMIGVFIVLYLCLTLCTSNLMFIALGDRIIDGPAAGHYNYYDFFSDPNHPFLYFRDSILRFFADSPYAESVTRIIGSSPKYYSGAYNNMNNGLFSVAFAEFGYFGVLLQPVLIVVLFYCNLKIIHRYDDLIQYILIVLYALYLLSTSCTSWLLTGGLIVEMIVLYAFQFIDTRIIWRKECT